MTCVALKLWLIILLPVVAGATWLVLWREYRFNRIDGRTAMQWARAFNTTTNSQENPLTLKLLTTRAKYGDWLFEVPISYDAIYKGSPTNHGATLHLLVDGKDATEAQRATNGNCLLVWPAIYDAPGTHKLQTSFLIGLHDRVGVGGLVPLELLGPVYSVHLTNAFQLDPFWNQYSASRGAFLHADVASTNAQYEVTLYDSSGNLLKAFQGNLSNTVLDQHWDLLDAQGNQFSGGWFNAVYRITLPGRTPDVQTQTVHRAYP